MKDLIKEGYLIVPTEDLIAFREDVFRWVDLNSSSMKWFDTDWVDWETEVFYRKKLGYMPDSVCFRVKCVRKYDIRVCGYAPKGVESFTESPFFKDRSLRSSRLLRLYHVVLPKRLEGEVVEIYKKGKLRYKEDVLLDFYNISYRDFYKPFHKKGVNFLTYRDFLRLSLNITKYKIEFLRGNTLLMGITNKGIVFNLLGHRIASIGVNRFEDSLCTIFNEYLGLDKPTENGVRINFSRDVTYNKWFEV